VCVPDTVKDPGPPRTVPAVVVPSPQSMVAVKSAAVAWAFESVNAPTAPMNDDCSPAEIVMGDAGVMTPGTWMCEKADAGRLGLLFSNAVTRTLNLPPSA